MSSETKIKRYVAVLLASAVLWIFLGSLINFHQHRIFGKQLIEEASPFIKPKDEKTFTLQFTSVNSNSDYQDYFHSFLFVIFILSIVGFIVSWRKKTHHPSFLLTLKSAEFPYYKKFRGPPGA